MSSKYWVEYPESPFAALLRISDTYCHPEADEDAYEELLEVAASPEPPTWIQAYKQQLREALLDPSQLPAGALFEAAKYGDGSDEAFLWRLWRDLYGDEPVSPGDGPAR